ncbi:MAG: Multi-copper polyphenol oxidoreductase laccase [Candidatus Parcubacteria bacterium]|jgi:copper oxidase (laccase) domain-containing protein
MNPTQVIIPSGAHYVGCAKVFCFGPGKEKNDWSLNKLQSSQDVVDSLTAYVLFSRIQHIAQTAQGRDQPIRTVYAPRLDDWKANLVTPADFPEKVTHQDHPLQLFRGARGAGMVVPKNTAVFFPTADCPVVIMSSPRTKQVVAAHAGLRELVDFDRVLKDTPSRPNESVIDAMIASFPESERPFIELKTVCGIQRVCYRHPVDHPTYGAQNRKLIHDLLIRVGNDTVHSSETAGRICLRSIIWYQAVPMGIKHTNISSDGVDTYTDAIGTAPAWWSHRRAVDNEQQDNLTKRNGVLVINP